MGRLLLFSYFTLLFQARLQDSLILRSFSALLFQARRQRGDTAVVEGEREVHRVLHDKLRFLEDLEKRVVRELTCPKPLEEIVKNVFDDRNITNLISLNDGWLSLLTDSDFSRSNLVLSFVKNHYHCEAST